MNSPDTFPISGHFSDEDIHELLGAMGDHSSAAHSEQEFSSNDEEPAVTSSTALPGDNRDEHHATTSEQEESAVSAEALAQARSERKRSREKQRRSDVNKQFADLQQILRRIETEDLEDVGLANIALGGPTNRVDLIARTIAVLERMHDMNGKRKREVSDLNRQLEDMKKMAEDTAARLKEATVYQQGPPKPVMMMVPMMVNPGQPGATAMGAAPGFAMASPFMQQQQAAMFMPQMAAAMPQHSQTTQVPTTQQTQVHQQMHVPQPSMAFPQMMFGSTAPPPPPAPAPTTATNHPASPKQSPTNINNGGGGNLAHCA
jgi:hypothetical protein